MRIERQNGRNVTNKQCNYAESADHIHTKEGEQDDGSGKDSIAKIFRICKSPDATVYRLLSKLCIVAEKDQR